jgi:hypothetical protein
MIRWVSERVEEAQAILSSTNATASQRSVARLVLATWSVI